MGRLKKEIRYAQRYKKIWYYKIEGKSWKSTGTTSKTDAKKIAEKVLQGNDKIEFNNSLFKEYARDFFLVGKCPRAMRLELEGRKPTDRYLKIQRINLNTHVFSSDFSNIPIKDIRRSHIIDYRQKLIEKDIKPSTINKIMSGISVIFSEALYREDLMYNPTNGLGTLKEDHSKKDIFTDKELKVLFNKNTYEEIWGSYKAYLCFLLALNTGMRRGEILALKWKHVDFINGYISIEEAWKDVETIGKPKSGKARYTPIIPSISSLLIEFRDQSYTNNEDDLVFCNDDGSRLGETWWRKRFKYALEKAKIKQAGRNLTPHTLRHTLNTKLRDSGENPEKIRASLGWSTEAIQNRYTHWKPEHFEGLGKSIERQFNDFI